MRDQLLHQGASHVPYVASDGAPACSCGWRAEGWWPVAAEAQRRALTHAQNENAKADHA